ncbi:MAG: hypothetical protein J0M22_16315 [Gammaproteobacteria bacterium]|nr:hypothetical protein [Gammaproteobacteria bacterium]
MMWAKFRTSITPFWEKLNLVQRWYFLATLSLLLWLITFASAEPLYIAFVVLLIGAAIIDMWQSSIRIWHSLPGKVLLLASYAILANFCYAYAESQMNAISGVKPDLTPFSVHFMIALQAPIWTFILSILMSMAYLAVHTSKVLLMVLIRPVSKVHAEMMHQESYPFISLLARIVYLPVVLVFVSIGLQGYLTGTTVLDVNLDSGSFGAKTGYDTSEQTSATDNKEKQMDPIAETSQGVTNQASEQTNEPEELNLISGVPSIPWANKLVANFLYEVESQGRSHCKISGVEHAVQINDYEILVIIPDKTQELGYQFTVRGCNSTNLPKILQLDTPSH